MDLEGKKLKQVIDPKVAKALTHPARGHIWVTLFEKGETSPAAVARELDVEARDLGYHFQGLEACDLARLDRIEPKRGWEGHIYRPVAPVMDFGDAEWMELPEGIRATLSGETVKQVIMQLVDAFEAGSFDARDRHLSQTWLMVDERGWRESMRVMRRALDQLLAIHERCETSSEPRIPVAIVMAAFETAASISAREAGKTDSL